MEEKSAKQKYLTQLRQILTDRFGAGELRTLCFDLGIDYDDLPGDGKTDKARELVSYLDNRGRISELIEMGRQLRPNVTWKGSMGGTGSPEAAHNSSGAQVHINVQVNGEGNTVITGGGDINR